LSRDKRIFDLWLACWTQEEIAKEVGCSQQATADIVKTFTGNGKVADSGKVDDSEDSATFRLTPAQLAASQHNDGTDDEGNARWTPPIYNIWKQAHLFRGRPRGWAALSARTCATDTNVADKWPTFVFLPLSFPALSQRATVLRFTSASIAACRIVFIAFMRRL